MICKAFNCAVMHPKKPAGLKRVAVFFADAHSGRSRAHVGEEARRCDVLTQATEILIAPSRSKAE